MPRLKFLNKLPPIKLNFSKTVPLHNRLVNGER
jgi:hypothetical protein